MKQTKQLNFEDFEDFEDLDTVLVSKEFYELYNSLPNPRPVSVNNNKGMTIEDISGFPDLPHHWNIVTEL